MQIAKQHFIILILTWACSLHCANAPLANLSDETKDVIPTPLSDNDEIHSYFKNFEILSRSEKWADILAQGSAALEKAKANKRYSDEAKICAQLTSTAYYMGDFSLALRYAIRCHELSERFEDISIFIRALYLESAIHRALAAKAEKEKEQQALYYRAATLCEEAASLCIKMKIEDPNLLGKVYFNIGATHADNPKGEPRKAKEYYSVAIHCFKKANNISDVIRTSIRLGKVYLMQNKFNRCQQILDQIRPILPSVRLAMHADFLEAQLKFSLGDFEKAYEVASSGLEKAHNLGAKEDALRLQALLKKIKESS